MTVERLGSAQDVDNSSWGKRNLDLWLGHAVSTPDRAAMLGATCPSGRSALASSHQ